MKLRLSQILQERNEELIKETLLGHGFTEEQAEAYMKLCKLSDSIWIEQFHKNAILSALEDIPELSYQILQIPGRVTEIQYSEQYLGKMKNEFVLSKIGNGKISLVRNRHS